MVHEQKVFQAGKTHAVVRGYVRQMLRYLERPTASWFSRVTYRARINTWCRDEVSRQAIREEVEAYDRKPWWSRLWSWLWDIQEIISKKRALAYWESFSALRPMVIWQAEHGFIFNPWLHNVPFDLFYMVQLKPVKITSLPWRFTHYFKKIQQLISHWVSQRQQAADLKQLKEEVKLCQIKKQREGMGEATLFVPIAYHEAFGDYLVFCGVFELAPEQLNLAMMQEKLSHYKRQALQIHPDKYCYEQEEAKEVFNEFWQWYKRFEALKKDSNGSKQAIFQQFQQWALQQSHQQDGRQWYQSLRLWQWGSSWWLSQQAAHQTLRDKEAKRVTHAAIISLYEDNKKYYAALRVQLEPLWQKLAQQKQRSQQLRQEIIQQDQDLQRLRQEIIPQDQDLQQLGQEIPQDQDLQQLGQEIPQDQDLQQLGQEIAQEGQDLQQLGQEIAQEGQDLQQLRQEIAQEGQDLQQLRQKITQHGQGLQQLRSLIAEQQDQMQLLMEQTRTYVENSSPSVRLPKAVEPQGGSSLSSADKNVSLFFPDASSSMQRQYNCEEKGEQQTMSSEKEAKQVSEAPPTLRFGRNP